MPDAGVLRRGQILSRLLPLEAVKAERERRRRQAEMERVVREADAIRERCKKFSGFVQECWHVLEPGAAYVHNWHIDAIGEHVEALNRGEIKRLQINQPPGTMKSLTVSVMAQAWEWGPRNMAWLRYLTTSYKEHYARRDSRKTRDLVLSDWYRALWPHVVLTRDTEVDFENTERGTRTAVAFTGLTSGRGNRLIIDDPHSVDTAESDTDREKVTRRFREAATSRLNDPEKDAILVMMHRLHPEDVCGVIEELELPYVKLVIPMEYVRSLVVKTPYFTDPRTEDGELLCPERHPREVVEQNKIELGEYAYQTQYQQQTRERSGTEFFLESDLLEDGKPLPWPRTCHCVFAVIDSAVKTGRLNDGTGVIYCAVENLEGPRPLTFLDWEYTQIEGDLLINWLPHVFERLEELAKLCGARMGSIGVYIEDAASGMILLQQAQRRGMPAEAIDSKLTSVGKVERAINVSGYVRQKMVGISEAAYNKTSLYHGRTRNHLLYQVIGFRTGVKDQGEDDLLDCFTYSIALSLGNGEGF